MYARVSAGVAPLRPPYAGSALRVKFGTLPKSIRILSSDTTDPLLAPC